MRKNIKDKEINRFLDKYEASIKKIYSPQGLWFFGSRTTGRAKENSDIDMIVVSDKFKGTKFINRMGEFLKRFDFPRHIDAICYTPEEFEKKKKEIGFVSEALQNGLNTL
jgi:predicted nucleotidyltransferase